MSIAAMDDCRNDNGFLNSILAVGACIACFRGLTWVFGRLDAWGIWTLQALPLVALLLALLMRHILASEVARPFRLLAAGLALILGTYGLLSPLTYPTGISTASDTLLVWFSIASYGQFGCAVLSIFRPSFAVVPAVFVLATKDAANRLFDLHMSNTDYIALVDLAIYGFAALLVYRALELQTLAPRIAERVKRYGLKSWTLTAFLTSVAIHFANYFYSAIAKIMLEGGPFLWVANNPTEVLAYNAWYSGFLPLAHWETISIAVLTGLAFLRPLSNVLLFVGQLASIGCLWRRWSMIAITLFYDLTHVTIFLVSGIFFWKWILLNLLLVAALRQVPKSVLRAPLLIVNSLVLLCSPLIFNIVWLGWYDTPALTRNVIVAVLEDGRELEVPSNYFGTISLMMAQHDLGRPTAGHFPTETWGSTKTSDILLPALKGCDLAPDEGWHLRQDREKIEKPIQLLHRYALQKEASSGAYAYDLYPHHIWSNPFLFGEFSSVLPSEINHYLYKTESVCISVVDDRPMARFVHEDEIEIPLVAKAK
ncbi:hypothetical protein [uncultured Roseibium sp.]|uniref:hypothetical protein n=1 Tax=uncultured Roseibium sp. TaxID=1936171 RepID=UPI00259A1BBA|nr:hypothetical protein [uncultured Roseibium sp.]